MTMMNTNDYNLVILCIKSNIESAVNNINLYRRFLNPKKIVIIASSEAGKLIPDSMKNEIDFIDEDSLYEGMSFSSVREYISSIDPNGVHRTGWYFQQFLKLAYSFHASENYLIWDSDTVPLHEVSMIHEGKLFFDVKTEFNKAYFDTLERLFPELKKENDFSFISEHMIFDSSIVKEMLGKIGETFWKKILDSVSVKDLSGSGFSEFETYGTYVMKYHPEKYRIRKWTSFREEAIFFPKGISPDDFNRLGLNYDAKSFENHEIYRKLSRILGHRIFQNRFFIKSFLAFKDFIRQFL